MDLMCTGLLECHPAARCFMFSSRSTYRSLRTLCYGILKKAAGDPGNIP